MLRVYFGLLCAIASAVVSAQTRPMSTNLSSNSLSSNSASSYPSSYPSDTHSDGDTLPARDLRAANPPHNLDSPRVFPHLASRAVWEARRDRLRQQILVSCGLYPLPPKTPLRPKIFDRVERDGYTIEKVYFQTYPGFYLAGNLYRPWKGDKETGRQGDRKDVVPEHLNTRTPEHPASAFPGILIAHGHWNDGRMADGTDGSIAARAITFARQGCVALTYDMVGYNDTRQIPQHRTFAADRQSWLWGVSLMGLQTWNSVRALDFLAALPDVDKSRLAITGESGGGTQTMMLGAIDDRLAAASPCVMVSHSMQGGCLCENAPGLRVDNSNMEIAAVLAPKPQIMVGAAGDWTQTMLTIEGPGVQSVYDFYNQPDDHQPDAHQPDKHSNSHTESNHAKSHTDSLKYVLFPFNHNINKTSRDAVYQFFGSKLLHDPSADTFTEPPYRREPVADLRVFPDDKPLPTDAKTADQLTQYLKDLGQAQLEKAKPRDKRSLTQFKKAYQPAWERTLNVESPDKETFVVERKTKTRLENGQATLLLSYIGRRGRGDRIPLRQYVPDQTQKVKGRVAIAVLLHPQGHAAFMENAQTPGPLVRALLAKGVTVALPDLFLTGDGADAQSLSARRKALDDFGEFFTTYNRTDLQERVQDIVTVCAFLRRDAGVRVSLVGAEGAGAWAMLAAPAADAVAADVNQLDLTNDTTLLTDDFYVPCLRRMGDFRTALTLAAPHPLLLHNTGENFHPVSWIRDVYTHVNAAPVLHISPEPMPEDKLVTWLTPTE